MNVSPLRTSENFKFKPNSSSILDLIHIQFQYKIEIQIEIQILPPFSKSF